MEERFEVLEGQVAFRLGVRGTRAEAGERLVVAPKTLHAFRNPTDSVARIMVDVRPALDMQQCLADAAALARAGAYTRRGVPRSIPGLLQVAAFERHYRDTMRLLVPPLARPLALDPLAALAERRGHRA